MMFDKRKNVIAIASIAFLLAGCTDYAQEFRDEYGPGGNGSSEEISELDYDCSVSEGVRVLYPEYGGGFYVGDTITIVYGSDVRGSGYRFVFLDDGDNQVDLLDKTVGPTAPDGKTCYTQKVVFDNEFFLQGTAGSIAVIPVEYPFLAGTSGIFKVYTRHSTEKNEAIVDVTIEPCRTGGEDTCQYHSFTDERDGQTYKTILVGNTLWMAENLKYENGGLCYDNNIAMCDQYGRLYTWKKAESICPVGWRLPTKNELEYFIQSIGGIDNAGAGLKALEGWRNKNGNDNYGLAMLPGGLFVDDEFTAEGERAFFWTSTEYNTSFAYSLGLLGEDNVYLNLNDKTSGFSVRCVWDR